MAKIFDGYYDATLSRALAEEYQTSGDEEALDVLVEQIAPLINVVLNQYITRYSLDEDPNVLKSDTLGDIFDLLVKKCIPTENTRVFTNFLFTRIRWSLSDSIRRSKEQVFDYWKVTDDPTELNSALNKAHENIEFKIYAEQITSILKSMINEDIRFSGKDRLACQYVSMCLLGYYTHDPMSIQFRFKLTRARAEMLVKYTTILVKNSTYELREIEKDEIS